VILVILAGPALQAGEGDFARRFVAWGVLIALVGALAYTPIMERLLHRFDGLRRLLGRALIGEDIDRLTERIHDPRLTEEQMMDIVAKELSRLLVADVRFLTDPSADEVFVPLWRYFSEPDRSAFNRLDAPTLGTARALTESNLHAVFPLRVGEELSAVLAVGASTAGGGYQEGEMEAIRLALRQLATSLEVRRLMEARVADERRRAEQERLGMLGLVSASLAHELKNPLSSMKVLAQTVQEEIVREEPSSEQGRDLGLIVEQIDHLNDVAKEILEFSRPKQGSEVDLASIVKSSSYVLDHEARRRGVVVDASGILDVGLVPGTKASWQTVVFNLILNAIQHAPTGSAVKLRLVRKEERIRFETENAGPPIPPEVSRRLFDAFVTDESGTGLGLALVDRKVGELGGTVELVNEPDQIVFRVCLDSRAVTGVE
jgi:signal transduction histidine kinase